MKKLVVLVFVCGALFAANDCDKKIAELQGQIKIAKMFNDSKKLDALEDSLAKLEKTCGLKEKVANKLDETKKDIENLGQKGKDKLSDGADSTKQSLKDLGQKGKDKISDGAKKLEKNIDKKIDGAKQKAIDYLEK